MTAPVTWAVLLPIRKQHAANIYAGIKTVELRKTVPRFCPSSYSPAKYPFRVYLYESKADGGAGMITGYFNCTGFLGILLQTENEKYPQGFIDRAQVSAEYIKEYANGGWVYGWEVREPTRLPEPVTLSTLGIDRAPQSWRYLGTDACTILEVAARGSPAK